MDKIKKNMLSTIASCMGIIRMNLKDDMATESVKVNCEATFALAKAFETVYKLEETEKQEKEEANG